MEDIKIVLLTSDKLRHIWLANQLAKNFNLAGIVSEPKSEFYRKVSHESWVINKHFILNELHEKLYFGDIEDFPACERLSVKRNDMNDKELIEWVRAKTPDIIMLFGTSLLKELWFENFGDRIINMHLGLSPYYKGSGTNYWPLVNRVPEYVGATIHVTNLDIDSGDIICQIRPEIAITDNPYDIGMKTIKKGVDAFIGGVKMYLKGIKPVPQKELFNGCAKPYKRKDFNESSVLTLWKNFNDGMINEYLNNIETRRKNVPIIDIKAI
jgi:folate-dependent phosphoribosylglycinamide formyltransferase PurN